MSDIKPDGSEILHYDNPEFPVLCRDNFIPAAYPLHRWTPIHWHEEVELIYVTEGLVHHKINADRVTLKKGEGLFINSKQLHELVTDEESSCRIYCLIFNPRMLGNCIHMERCVQALIENESVAYAILHEDKENENAVLQDVKTACEYWKKEEKESYQISALYVLWDHLLKLTQVKNMKDSPVDSTQKIVRNMLHFIQTRYKENVTLEDICKAGNMGKTKATRLFKQYVHMTPIECLKCYRLEKSIELLENTDLSMTEIAYEVGFQGNSYYGEAFKKMVGVTPLTYRKKVREEREYDD